VQTEEHMQMYQIEYHENKTPDRSNVHLSNQAKTKIGPANTTGMDHGQRGEDQAGRFPFYWLTA
jgi:hypothetical protein